MKMKYVKQFFFQMDAYCQNLSNGFIIKFVLRENLTVKMLEQ